LPSDLVPKLVAAVLIETRPRKYRFEIDYELPLTYDEIEVGGNRQLASVAEITGVEAQTLKELNPELLQGYTPAGTSLSSQAGGRQWCDPGTAATRAEAT
jgi:membrane-bound lytic murein transglycosylase D